MFTIGINTTGANTSVTVVQRQDFVDQIIEPKILGTDQLFSVIESLFSRNGFSWSQFEAIGVSTGPGNFNGIRQGISAARGLSMALQIPAIGISNFDAASYGHKEDLMIVLKAVKDKFFCRIGSVSEPFLAEWNELIVKNHNKLNVVGVHSDALANAMGVQPLKELYESSFSIALQTEKAKHCKLPQPSPLYVSQPRVDSKSKKLVRNHVQ